MDIPYGGGSHQIECSGFQRKIKTTQSGNRVEYGTSGNSHSLVTPMDPHNNRPDPTTAREETLGEIWNKMVVVGAQI